MDRSTYIEKRLTKHCEDIEVFATPTSAAAWATIEGDGQYRADGWLAPTQTAGGLIRWPFCPDIIAAATEGLDRATLDRYLAGVEFITDLEIIHRALTPTARAELIDRTLYDCGPQYMELMNEVHMKALDRRAAE